MHLSRSPEATDAGPSPAASSAPILIVDDDALIRQALEALFEDEGYTVVMAASGQQALQRTERVTPALVVLDMNLPPLDGEHVAAALRTAHGPDLPILVISADGHLHEKALRVHATAYLRKPFQLEALVQLVRYHMRQV